MYAVFTIRNGGRPYYGAFYSSLEECKENLLKCVAYEKRHKKLIYIDNDFYQNEFPYFPSQSIYYCIHKREVSEWVKLEDNLPNLLNKKTQDKIINFNKYIDIC